MKISRKAILSIAASAALIATAAVVAKDRHRDGPRVALEAPSPAMYVPPMYFGPAYSAAAVYEQVRRRATPRRG